MMSIYSVKLYKLNGLQWVFDDPAKDIYREAFVAGADTLIDKIIGKYDKDANYTLQFSTKDFPGSIMIDLIENPIEWDEVPEITDTGSWWVTAQEKPHVLWLCDTLDEYIAYNEDGTHKDKSLYITINIGKK